MLFNIRLLRILDFTIIKYKQLLESMRLNNYKFQRFDEYVRYPANRAIILRQDVDSLPQNSLNFAEIQYKLGIKSTFYFRNTPNSFNETIIKKIAHLGHEIGYHYENLSVYKGDYDKAILDFEQSLIKFRSLVPISTICMHGSPLSRYDPRDLWKKYNYKNYEIIGEPYFDLDFNKVLYLTDTGRKWNGNKSNIRDNVSTLYNFNFKLTDEIIQAIKLNSLPDQLMINFHPQRWTDNQLDWIAELFKQKVKNQFKKLLK